MDTFLKELKRRNVVRVGVAYVVTAWILLQVGELLSSIQILPEWVPRILFFVLAIGFFASLVLAWVYEVTEKGIQRDSVLDRDAPGTIDRRKLDFTIMGLLAVALGYMLLDKFVFDFSAAETAERDRSIAVLPFANRSELVSDLHFVDGIHDDILTQLANLTGLEKVISRTSVERFRDTDQSIPEIGRALDVEHVLEGGVQRAGDRIRINMQLIATDTDEHLWAETYDREMTVENLFAIQSEIAREIVASLHGALSAQDDQKLDRVPTTSLEAYGEFVLGRQAKARRQLDEIEKAITHFEKAIELDPEYALPYANLADALQFRAIYKREDPALTIERREILIERALDLDPLSGEVWTSLGLLRDLQSTINGWDQAMGDSATRAFERAIELSPSYATAWQWYSHQFNRPGNEDFEKALKLIGRAIELDPMAGILRINQVDTLQILGRHEQALEVLLAGVARDPGFRLFYLYLGNEYAWHGQIAEALRWARAGNQVFSGQATWRDQECQLLLDLGDDIAAGACFDDLIADFPQEAHQKSAVYFFRGQYDRQLDYVQNLSHDQRPSFYPALLTWSYMDVGEFDKALALSREYRPSMYLDEPVILENWEHRRRAEVGLLLLKSGDIEGANRWYDQILEIAARSPRLGRSGIGWWDIGVYIQRGEKELALTTLREAIDAGVRDNWWALKMAPYMAEPMKDEPEWHALWAELKADIDRQREWYYANREEPLLP